MRFIERLKMQISQEEEARRQLASRENALRERDDKLRKEKQEKAFQEVLQAREQFDKSGVGDLIDSLLEIKPELEFEIDPTNCDNNLSLIMGGFYKGDGRYKCRIILTDRTISHGSSYVRNKKYIGIVVAHDGVIRFDGDRRKGTSVVPKNIWEGNKNVLEDALEKAYEHPQTESLRENYSGPDPGWGGF